MTRKSAVFDSVFPDAHQALIALRYPVQCLDVPDTKKCFSFTYQQTDNPSGLYVLNVFIMFPFKESSFENGIQEKGPLIKSYSNSNRNNQNVRKSSPPKFGEPGKECSFP